MISKAAALLAALALLPAAAAAQTDPPATPNTQGPMIVERVHSGFLVEPDVKVTRFDRKTSELVGGYGGWLTDETLFIGGGGYWLANPRDDRRLGYGGVVVQWLFGPRDPIGFTVKGLVGGGQSTTTRSLTQLVPVRDMHGMPPFGRTDADQYVPTTVRFRARQAFFLAEPEIDLLLRVSSRVRITAGAGYRFTGADRHDRGFDARLDGPVATFGVQVGPRF